MNTKRRIELTKAINLLKQARDVIDSILGEELEAYYNMPESLQCSERGETMYGNIKILEQNVSNIDYVQRELSEIIYS